MSKQNSNNTIECIKKTILENSSNKLFFNEDFSYSYGENGFFYYEDNFGGLKLPLPNILGQFQLENISTVLNEYLQTLDCKKHVIIGMMANKDHEKYISYFRDISSVTTIDIPNQLNSISGIELKKKFKKIPNVEYKESIEKAIKSIQLKENDLIVITGSLYLCGEFLKLN